jgi:hypothetical protein
MTTSYTTSATKSFSLASARYVCSKVATDLRQMQRTYLRPSNQAILDYAEEAAVLSHYGYLDKVTYGFQRNGSWIFALEYRFVDGVLQTDQRAGGVYRDADITGADFSSFLEQSHAWRQLTPARRAEVEAMLPVDRTPSPTPGYFGGYHVSDRGYSTNGAGFTRSTYRPL